MPTTASGLQYEDTVTGSGEAASADDPRYPADEAKRALRIGSNAAVYAMTH